MSKFHLDQEKLNKFIGEYQAGLTWRQRHDVLKKHGLTEGALHRYPVGELPLAHFIDALTAANRGKIHARRIGVVRTYGTTQPARQNDTHHNWVARPGHHQPIRHQVTGKHYSIIIDTLDQQNKFLGDWANAFGMSQKEYDLRKAKRLEAAAVRLRSQYETSEYATEETEQQVVLVNRR